jgi:hypothetical protein
VIKETSLVIETIKSTIEKLKQQGIRKLIRELMPGKSPLGDLGAEKFRWHTSRIELSRIFNNKHPLEVLTL